MRRTVYDVGGQLDFQFSILGTLDMGLSVGAAVAFEEGRRLGNEAMISVKVLR